MKAFLKLIQVTSVATGVVVVWAIVAKVIVLAMSFALSTGLRDGGFILASLFSAVVLLLVSLRLGVFDDENAAKRRELND